MQRSFAPRALARDRRPSRHVICCKPSLSDYNLTMTKKITLEILSDQITSLASNMEKGFAAVADDITDIKHNMATKDQVLELQTQVNGIEGQLRETKINRRLGDLEVDLFGKARG
jgi:hypothetical protein